MYRHYFTDAEKPLKRLTRTGSFMENFKSQVIGYIEMTEAQVDAEFETKITEKSLSSLLVNKFRLKEPTFEGTGIKELKKKVPLYSYLGRFTSC